MRTKKVMELLDLVLFRYISKLFQEAFQVTGQVKVIQEENERVKDDLSKGKGEQEKAYLKRSGVRKLSRWKSSSRLF